MAVYAGLPGTARTTTSMRRLEWPRDETTLAPSGHHSDW
jgi:hypothetical protein